MKPGRRTDEEDETMKYRATWRGCTDVGPWRDTYREALDDALEDDDLRYDIERDPPLSRPANVPWVEVDTEVLPDGSAPIRLSRSVRVF